jgi:hypothetical protein
LPDDHEQPARLRSPGRHPARIWQALAAGWIPGPPDELSDDALLVDKFTAAVMACEKCERRGGLYRAVHRLDPPAYRAWSCCRQCGHATEM